MEHVLQWLEKSPPNSNMLDFGVTVMDETYGRERRHRWFTFKGYKALLNQEDINEVEHELVVDLANAGGFTGVSPELFYDTLGQLHQYQDTDTRDETAKKRKPPKNPILPDGTVKKGRPRKDQGETNKRKKEELGEDDVVSGQAHPPKRTKVAAAGGGGVFEAGQGMPVAEPTPKKGGRPPKRKPVGEPSTTPTPRKRGRPPKNHTPVIVEEQETQDCEGQVLPTIAPPSVSVQEVVPEIVCEELGPSLPSYLEAFGQTVQQEGTPETNTLYPVEGSQQTLPPESQFPIPESREIVQTSRQDADGVCTSHRPRMKFTQCFIRIPQAIASNHPKLWVQRNPV